MSLLAYFKTRLQDALSSLNIDRRLHSWMVSELSNNNMNGNVMPYLPQPRVRRRVGTMYSRVSDDVTILRTEILSAQRRHLNQIIRHLIVDVRVESDRGRHDTVDTQRGQVDLNAALEGMMRR